MQRLGGEAQLGNKSNQEKKKRSRRKGSRKMTKQVIPMNFGGYTGFAEGDKFRATVERALKSILNRPLSQGELNLALTILDGGHSYEAMRDCSAFPDKESSANEIFHNAQQYDFDITVAAGTSCMVYQVNHPFICAIVVNNGAWFAIPWIDAAKSTNPGRYFRDKGVVGYRKLASTITCTNSTPSNDRGGICYSDVIQTQWFTQNDSAVMNGPIATDVNNPVVYGLPSTPGDFLSSDSYRTGIDTGAYVIGRAMSREWIPAPAGQHELTSNYPASTILNVGDKDHQLKFLSLNTNKTTAGTPLIYQGGLGVVGSKPVILPFTYERFEVPAVCYQAPGRDQLLHFKIHAMWEYLLDSSSENNFPKRTKVPNDQFVTAIDDACMQFPQLLPPEYNSWGAVGRWFQKLYQGLKPALDPLISGAIGPLGGAAINTALDSLSKISIK